MATLILPVAGKSSRFPGMRPKWLLTMPDGNLMIEKSIELFNINQFSRIVVICLKEHIERYLNNNYQSLLFNSIRDRIRIEYCVLDSPTSSQAETVYQGIKKMKIEGAVFVKDCDNIFEFDFSPKNQVAVIDLNNINLVDAKSKSYVTINEKNLIRTIVEKNVISNFFCAGGYGFDNANDFIKHYESIEKNSEIYISHIIYSMLLKGNEFEAKKASQYTDLGTLREFKFYIEKFVTVFCDVDGVLLSNGSKFGVDAWRTNAIIENINLLVKLQMENRLYLVITSSRPESELDYLVQIFDSLNLRPNKYILGLPHTKRILINDFANTNPYPSAVSINIERDSNRLSEFLLPIINNKI